MERVRVIRAFKRGDELQTPGTIIDIPAEVMPKLAGLVVPVAADRRLKINRDPSGREAGFELDGPPSEPGPPTPEPTRPESFDTDLWAARISATVEQVAATDRGSLAHCREHHPELHRQCLESARRVDESFSLGDESSLDDALARFEGLHQEARAFFQGGGHASS